MKHTPEAAGGPVLYQEPLPIFEEWMTVMLSPCWYNERNRTSNAGAAQAGAHRAR